MSTPRSLFFAALTLVLGACTSSPTGSGSTDAGDDSSPDVAQDVAQDVPLVPDVEPDVDVAPDLPPGAELGEACDDDDACESNRCIDLAAGEAGGICTQVCVDDNGCPRGFDCVLIADGGADAQRICLPNDLCLDPDGDRYGVGPDCLGRDCDESSAAVNSGADELCDGTDNDCDGEFDENALDVGDDCDTGFTGVCAEGRTVCESGLLGCSARTVGSAEVCDNLDNDCDGAVDEDDAGEPLTRDCYDGDASLLGIGVCTSGLQTCSTGGYSACQGQVLATTELCDELDNDCDGSPDEGLALVPFYPDTDDDTFGDATAEARRECRRPEGFVENRGDCDDGDATIRPGAGEIPGDEVDQNCDGTEFCYEDGDGDGYRPDSGAVIVSIDPDCSDDGEAVAGDPAGDCNDRQITVFPLNPEVCDRLDNDCNDRIDDAAMCYAVGEPCEGPADCATELCEEGLCVAPITCVEDGSCPQRLLTTSGAAGLESERYRLDVSAPNGVASPTRDSERFRLIVGPTPYTTDP